MKRSLQQLVHTFKLIGRPGTSAISFLYCFLILWYLSPIHPIDAFFYSLPMFFVAVLGFCFNDLLDYRSGKDAFNQSKPLVSGVITKKEVVKLSIVLMVLFYIPLLWMAHFGGFLIATIALTLVYLYSYFSVKWPAMKGIYTAILCTTPVVYAIVVGEIVYSIPFILSILVFITGRELALDHFDHKSDSKAGIKTLPEILGKKTSRILVTAFLFSTIGLISLLVEPDISQGLLFLIFALSTFLAVVFLYQRNELAFNRLTRIGMIVSLLIYLM